MDVLKNVGQGGLEVSRKHNAGTSEEQAFDLGIVVEQFVRWSHILVKVSNIWERSVLQESRLPSGRRQQMNG